MVSNKLLNHINKSSASLWAHCLASSFRLLPISDFRFRSVPLLPSVSVFQLYSFSVSQFQLHCKRRIQFFMPSQAVAVAAYTNCTLRVGKQ